MLREQSRLKATVDGFEVQVRASRTRAGSGGPGRRSQGRDHRGRGHRRARDHRGRRRQDGICPHAVRSLRQAGRHREHQRRRRRHRVAGLGRDAATHVHALGGASGLQGRVARRATGRRGWHQERHHGRRRASGPTVTCAPNRRASSGAHLAVRRPGAPAHLVCQRIRLPRHRRNGEGRHRREGSAH